MRNHEKKTFFKAEKISWNFLKYFGLKHCNESCYFHKSKQTRTPRIKKIKSIEIFKKPKIFVWAEGHFNEYYRRFVKNKTGPWIIVW